MYEINYGITLHKSIYWSFISFLLVFFAMFFLRLEIMAVDPDGDGVENYKDLDSDNDGILDIDEGAVFTIDPGNCLDPTFSHAVWNKQEGTKVVYGTINVDGQTVEVEVTSLNSTIIDFGLLPWSYNTHKQYYCPLPKVNNFSFRTQTGGVYKFVFSKPVVNPTFMINSLNRNMTFSDMAEVITTNGKMGVTNGSMVKVIRGNEGVGTFTFPGIYNEVSFTGASNEWYCDFSVGIAKVYTEDSARDTDDDGIPDYLDLDSDNDGISDLIESGADHFLLDPDNNGIIDGIQFEDLDNDGLADLVELNHGNDKGIKAVDNDGDGRANFLDLDSDADGIPDAIEAQTTLSYEIYYGNDGDVRDNDSDGDGIIDIYDGIPGHGGSFNYPENTDGSDVSDYLDIDSDNDGKNDAIEGGNTVVNIVYQDPDGSVNNPRLDLPNEIGDNTEVAYRELCIITLTTSSPHCESDGNTTFTATPGGGTWSGTGITAGGVFSPSSAGVGNHKIYYSLGGTCIDSASIVVNKNPSFTTSKIDETCGALGSLTLTGLGGTAPYSYSIDGGISFSSTNTFINLSSGNYDLVVMDAMGCLDRLSEFIDPPANVVIDSLVVIDDSCSSCQGEVSIYASGPPPLSYSIDNGSTFQVSNVFSNLCSGMLDVVVSTGSCSSNVDGAIANLGNIADATITDPGSICVTQGDVFLTAATKGGVWSGKGVDSVTGVFNTQNSGSGSFTITYTIGGACGNSDNITLIVTDTTRPVIDPVPPLCATGGPEGLTASTPGGTWSGVGVNGNIFDPAKAGPGTHYVLYTIEGTCLDTAGMSISVTDTLNPGINPVDPLCLVGLPVNLTSKIGGGTWSGNGVSNHNKTFNPQTAGVGTHKVYYTIVGICVDRDSINITVSDTITPVIDPVSTLCTGNTPIQLTTSIPGGVWSGSGVDSIGIFTPLEPGSFLITYSILGLCGNFDQIMVIVEDPPIIEVNSTAKNICSGAEVSLSYISTVPLSNCSWDFGDGTTAASCEDVTHAYTQVGCYDVTISGDTPAGCRAKKEATDLVCVQPDPAAAFESDKEIIKTSYPKISFTNLSENSITYVWDFAGEGSSTMEHPSHTFPQEPGLYNVCLEATSQYGCTDAVCHEVYVEEDQLISVPNVFTPNGDGLNDTFVPIIIGYGETPAYQMQIWNRWGELIFESTDTKEHWDGTVGGSEPLTNTYVWKMYINDDQGNTHDFIGHVSVLK